ncbi:MAG: VOC family protein [Candidatus Caenarcaniphilales bacterium]|nr:VOC family protein [Candidatus Caenarcaniphilales bacterium]
MQSKQLQRILSEYESVPLVQEKIASYFEKNKGAVCYLEVCEENNWKLIFDHLTIRTYSIEEASKPYENLGWKYDEKIDYRNEGWYAQIYRHSSFAPMFIDQSYEDAPENLKIVKKWVDKFGDKDFHHIAVQLPQGVDIEDAIEKLETKGVKFPGKITGGKNTRLRQIFTQAEQIDGLPFSVLELAQRGTDKETGNLYLGFITDQADSLMKDSVL